MLGAQQVALIQVRILMVMLINNDSDLLFKVMQRSGFIQRIIM